MSRPDSKKKLPPRHYEPNRQLSSDTAAVDKDKAAKRYALHLSLLDSCVG